MKTIKLNGKEYDCPTSWQNVTLKQQMQVSVDSDKIEIEELKKFAILSGYAGIPIQELKRAKISELTQLFKSIEFLNKDLPSTPVTEFDFNGNHYYVGQNLIEMEFQDFISIENAIQQTSGNTYQALPTIMAIMCKTKKDNGVLESLDEYDVKARAKEFLDIPITIAHGLSLFFSTSVSLSSTIFQLFSNPESQKELVMNQINSAETTLKELDGKGWLTRLQTGILRYWLKSTKRQLNKHFTSTA
jgi:hypothetical protein